jgi:hypothetical protein
MRTCAAAGCDNPCPQPRRGRPPIYCSPACRPSCRGRPSSLVVELDHPTASSDGRPPERVWAVSLRRGQRVVLIADNLGWPSANALAQQLADLITSRPRQKGAAID